VTEDHSDALEAHLPPDAQLVSSRIALVEVARAVKVADPSGIGEQETQRLLAACSLIDVSDRLLRHAAELASVRLRTLDALHLATALHVEPDEAIAYDRRLLTALEEQGLDARAPGRVAG
jgi:uncharacterized protein